MTNTTKNQICAGFCNHVKTCSKEELTEYCNKCPLTSDNDKDMLYGLYKNITESMQKSIVEIMLTAQKGNLND